MKPNTLKIALGELGQKEISGNIHNERILEYQAMTNLNFGNDEVAWCSIFANWVALQADLPRSNSAMARSWLHVGKKTTSPVPGDIIVMWRGSKNGSFGHVGFFLGYSKSGKSVYCIGGNQNDEVNITLYPKYKVLEFRSITTNNNTIDVIPTGYLRKGESNSRVKLLQQILINLNYLNGNADGIFGEKTEISLKRFQSDNNITVDGIYGSESREILESILNKQD